MISLAISAKLESLKAQVAAAKPLRNAPRATISAMKLNSAQLIDDVQAALTAPTNLLDATTTTADPDVIVAGMLALSAAGKDQADLALMRGILGRVASNLGQLPS